MNPPKTDQDAVLAELWRGGVPLKIIAHELGRCQRSILRAVDRLGLGRRRAPNKRSMTDA